MEYKAFLTIFAAVFVAELGDKTQLATVLFASDAEVSKWLSGSHNLTLRSIAKMEAALDAVVFGAYFNMGECCNAGSRLLVQTAIADQFVAEALERARTVPVGGPLDENTKVGAIINQNQYEKILQYVQSGQDEGANLAIGGSAMRTDEGRFIEPTIFTGVQPEMDIAKSEIFGPVLSILEFDTPEEAVRIANSTLFGLSAGVWTSNVDQAFKVFGKQDITPFS